MPNGRDPRATLIILRTADRTPGAGRECPRSPGPTGRRSGIEGPGPVPGRCQPNQHPSPSAYFRQHLSLAVPDLVLGQAAGREQT
jgi:hypothetical protein